MTITRTAPSFSSSPQLNRTSGVPEHARSSAGETARRLGSAAGSAADLGAQIRAHVQQMLSDAFTRASRASPIDLSGIGRQPVAPVSRPVSPVGTMTPPTSTTSGVPQTTTDTTGDVTGDDVSNLAPGSSTDLTDTNAASLIDAPLTSAPGSRSADEYNAVIDQFDVENNPRYAQRNGNTYCNIFASDVTRAMGAEIPHWVDAAGNPVGEGMGTELDANATNAWLNQHGAEHGWRQVSAEEAQRMANEGHPAVASWANPGGIGHIGVVRPGEMENGPALAQAGAQNVNQAHVFDIFPASGTEFWVHD